MTVDFSRLFDNRFEPARDGGFLSIEDLERLDRLQIYFMRLVKPVWRWCYDRPLVALALGAPTIIAITGITFWLSGTFTTGGNTNWNAIKEYIQTCGYSFGASGIGLGLHYAGRRTDAMMATNEIQGLARRNESFVNSINKLESKHSSLRIAAIKSLERLGKEADQEFYEETIAVLADFLVRESNQDTKTKDLDVGKNEIEIGFRSL